MYSRGQRLAQLRSNDAILFLNAESHGAFFVNASVAIPKYVDIKVI